MYILVYIIVNRVSIGNEGNIYFIYYIRINNKRVFFFIFVQQDVGYSC